MTISTQVDAPFPGLRSFEPDQADLFFGRDEQIEELVDRLQEHRFVAVVGTSGSGKSSLVRAGLIPALKRNSSTSAGDWRIAIFRPGMNPLLELAEAMDGPLQGFQTNDVLPTLRSSSAGLARFARQSLGPNEKLLIVVDQFEELFRYREEKTADGKMEDATAFVKLLLAASGHSDHPLPGFDEVPVYVVITMRSDFLGKCSLFGGLPEALNDSQYLVPRMTRDQQREVIEGPIGMAGASIEASLVQRLLNDVGDSPDQLPVLQHVLMRTWVESSEARARGEALRVEQYEAVGGIAQALDRDANLAFEALHGDQESESIARILFQRLVEPGAPDEETRRPTPLSEIVAVTAASEAKVKEVIKVFCERGFITMSGDDDPVIDITHESLIRNWSKLSKWSQEEARSAANYRRLAETAERYARKEVGLLDDPELQSTLNWRDENQPNQAWAERYQSGFAAAVGFLDHSKIAREDEIKSAEEARRKTLLRARITALVFFVFFVLAVGASILAWTQWNRTRAERDKSRRLLYDANIYSAQRAIAEGQVWRAQALLDELLDPTLKDLRGFEWSYLWLLAHADEATLRGHSDTVTSVAFSPDGKTIASAGGEQTVKLWDVASRKELKTLQGHSQSVDVVRFSPDGKILACADRGGRIKLWDLASNAVVATLESQSSEGLRSLSFSPDGRTIVAAGYGPIVERWDTVSYEPLPTFGLEMDFALDVAFSPDGKILASAGLGKVTLWNVASGKVLAKLSGHAGFVHSVAFSPDGKTLASAGSDKTVKLWDVSSHKELATLRGHAADVTVVVFSTDGKTLASASQDNTVKLWDFTSSSSTEWFGFDLDKAESREELVTFSGSASSLAFSPDGKMLATGSDNALKLWDATSRKEQSTVSKVERPFEVRTFSVAFSRDGKTLAFGSIFEAVKLWDIASRKELAATFEGKRVASLAFSPDGKVLAYAVDEYIKLWDTVSQAELGTLAHGSERVDSLAFSPDGKILAFAAGKDVKLWDVASHSELAVLSASDVVNSFIFSPDGNFLAAAAGKDVTFWHTRSHAKLATLPSASDVVNSLAFSPDGKILAYAGRDRKITFWDMKSGARADLSGHGGSVFSIAFSPDGKTLASASADGTVKLWDTASRKELATVLKNSETIYSLAFSPDGRILACAGDTSLVLRFAATEDQVNERRRQGY